MGDLPTIKVKHADGHMVINESDFDPNKHEPFDDEASKSAEAMKAKAENHPAVQAEEAKRMADANRGVTASPNLEGGKNPSGTFSTPTPSDVRYPNKDHTEFENNHGAFVGKSAAQMREALGLPDAPGGLNPQPTMEGSENDVAAGLHVGKGPRGKFYVKSGKDRVSEAFETEDEAKKSLKSLQDENDDMGKSNEAPVSTGEAEGMFGKPPMDPSAPASADNVRS